MTDNLTKWQIDRLAVRWSRQCPETDGTQTMATEFGMFNRNVYRGQTREAKSASEIATALNVVYSSNRVCGIRAMSMTCIQIVQRPANEI